MMTDSFTHEIGDDPLPRRRVRISGPVYDDGSVPLLRVEYEDGNAELLATSEMRLFRALQPHTRSALAQRPLPRVRRQHRLKQRLPLHHSYPHH